MNGVAFVDLARCKVGFFGGEVIEVSAVEARRVARAICRNQSCVSTSLTTARVGDAAYSGTAAAHEPTKGE